MDEMDMDLTPWLKGFVKSVGKQKAKMLLNETGVFAEKEFRRIQLIRNKGQIS